MPRPKYISDLHEAKYELRFCKEVGKAEKLERYKAALAAAAVAAKVTGPQIEAAVAEDFRIWVKQEKLPKPGK